MDNKLMITKQYVVVKQKPRGLKHFFNLLIQQRALVLMSVPFVIWLFIFKYLPIWGWTIAFQDYKPALGFGSKSGSDLNISNFYLATNAFSWYCVIHLL